MGPLVSWWSMMAVRCNFDVIMIVFQNYHDDCSEPCIKPWGPQTYWRLSLDTLTSRHWGQWATVVTSGDLSSHRLHSGENLQIILPKYQVKIWTYWAKRGLIGLSVIRKRSLNIFASSVRNLTVSQTIGAQRSRLKFFSTALQRLLTKTSTSPGSPGGGGKVKKG